MIKRIIDAAIILRKNQSVEILYCYILLEDFVAFLKYRICVLCDL